ncbi:MAG: DUF4382 domain-containing protein [Bacteroidetes bacterium]|nr:MAG: DUF4382 domain-containing protein [Bacteroidota bacterium]
MKLFPLIRNFAIVTLLIGACQKDANEPNPPTSSTTLYVHLTDGPGDYQQVNVDVQEVRLKLANDSSQWMTLATTPGVYNLLDFQNGVDTLIASGPVPTDTLKEVRLVLGADNTVMIDSVLYDLDTPSAQQSGLKIKINKSLGVVVDSLKLDFDAEKSIVKTGNGKFILKPVIKVVN